MNSIEKSWFTIFGVVKNGLKDVVICEITLVNFIEKQKLPFSVGSWDFWHWLEICSMCKLKTVFTEKLWIWPTITVEMRMREQINTASKLYEKFGSTDVLQFFSPTIFLWYGWSLYSATEKFWLKFYWPAQYTEAACIQIFIAAHERLSFIILFFWFYLFALIIKA